MSDINEVSSPNKGSNLSQKNKTPNRESKVSQGRKSKNMTKSSNLNSRADSKNQMDGFSDSKSPLPITPTVKNESKLSGMVNLDKVKGIENNEKDSIVQ